VVELAVSKPRPLPLLTLLHTTIISCAKSLDIAMDLPCNCISIDPLVLLNILTSTCSTMPRVIIRITLPFLVFIATILAVSPTFNSVNTFTYVDQKLLVSRNQSMRLLLVLLPRLLLYLSYSYSSLIWHPSRDSNPEPTVLETVALPIELLRFGGIGWNRTNV
jgi:hypothetical protein